MPYNHTQREPNMIDMKKSISDVGGLFYQYRSCKRNAATIYDIENIRHGVVYSQTPLNMNDPFDSMIGFSAEKIYENCISLIMEATEVDDNTKAIVSAFLIHRTFGKIAGLISSIKELKHYLNLKRSVMHQTNISFEKFVMKNAKMLYSKLPKNLKNQFLFNTFIAFSGLIGRLGEIEISEHNIIDMMKMEDILDELHAKAKEIRDNNYVPIMRKFLSQLTISCFSLSGWNNQLMWSHYANSYSGICVEYDFNRINDFIGFIFPVNYTTTRPTLSLQDLGIAGFDINAEDKIVHGDTDVSKIFSYLLSKNTCWKYENEWRIINIGEANKPIFIDLPFIKSITFGLNLDELCKRLLLEVCKEKNIECYELVLDKERFELSRQLITLDTIVYNLDDEVEYIKFLSEQVVDISRKIEQQEENLSAALAEGNFETDTYQKMLNNVIDFLCNAYFFKLSLNRMCDNTDEDLTQTEIPNEIVDTITEINLSVSMIDKFTETVKEDSLLNIRRLTKTKDYSNILKHLSDIKELVEKINNYSWNSFLIAACDRLDEVINYYDALIDENNDPVHDPKLLQDYMDKWDGQAFIDSMELNKDKSVLEIGVGTGRLAVRVVPLCGEFYGVDISSKTIECAEENLGDFKNARLICADFSSYEFGRTFDVIYSSLTFMHIKSKQSAINKVAALLNDNGRFVLSIDKNQSEFINTGIRKIRIFPDTMEKTEEYINAAGLTIINQYDTEFATIFVVKKVSIL